MGKRKKPGKLLERQVVMDLVPLGEIDGKGMAYFAVPHPDLLDELGDSLTMSGQDWRDFGRPEKITVRIRPGACIDGDES